MYLELDTYGRPDKETEKVTLEEVPFTLEELDKMVDSFLNQENAELNTIGEDSVRVEEGLVETYGQNMREVINLSTKDQFLASFVSQCEQYEGNEEVEELIFDGLVFRERTDMPALFATAVGKLPNSTKVTENTVIHFNNCTMNGVDFALWMDQYPMCVFYNTALREVKFSNAKMPAFTFKESDVAYSNFEYSDLTNAHFENSRLEGVNFVSADLENVTIDIPERLQKEYLRGTTFDERILPLLPSVLAYGLGIPPASDSDNDDDYYDYGERYHEE